MYYSAVSIISTEALKRAVIFFKVTILIAEHDFPSRRKSFNSFFVTRPLNGLDLKKKTSRTSLAMSNLCTTGYSEALNNPGRYQVNRGNAIALYDLGEQSR